MAQPTLKQSSVAGKGSGDDFGGSYIPEVDNETAYCANHLDLMTSGAPSRPEIPAADDQRSSVPSQLNLEVNKTAADLFPDALNPTMDTLTVRPRKQNDTFQRMRSKIDNPLNPSLAPGHPEPDDDSDIIYSGTDMSDNDTSNNDTSDYDTSDYETNDYDDNVPRPLSLVDFFLSNSDSYANLHDLSVDGTGHNLDFFPAEGDLIVETMLQNFPQMLTLVQKIKFLADHEHFTDTYMTAFQCLDPAQIPEEVKWLQGYTCITQHATMFEELQNYSYKAIEHLKQMYSAYECSDENKCWSNAICIVEHADAILTTLVPNLTNEVHLGNSKLRKLIQKVNEEIAKRKDDKKKLAELKHNYAQAMYKHKSEHFFIFLTALKNGIKHHVELLIKSAANTRHTDTTGPDGDGIHSYRDYRKREARKLLNLKEDIDKLKGDINSWEKTADQGDADMSSNIALEKLHLKLEIMDLHLLYVHYFLCQLAIHVESIEATFEEFCLVLFDKEEISMTEWKHMKYEMYMSNAWWVAINRLLFQLLDVFAVGS